MFIRMLNLVNSNQDDYGYRLHQGQQSVYSEYNIDMINFISVRVSEGSFPCELYATRS